MKAHLPVVPLIVLAALLSGVGALAQGVGPAVAPAPGAAATGLQTWRDVSILWMPQRLGLTADQAHQIALILQPLGQRLEASRAGRDTLWMTSGPALQAVIGAWCEGRQPDAANLNAANAAADQVAALDEALEQEREAALQAVLQVLSEEQAGLVETDEAAANRLRNQERLEGAPDLATYIANQLIAQRRLMPDDYELLREDTASLIISRTVRAGADPARVERARDRVLQLMDEAHNMDDAQFDAMRLDLPAQVAAYLSLPGPPAQAPISAEEFRAWVGDPRTGPYMAVYGTNSGPLGPAPVAQTAPLDAALLQARVLTLFQRLRLGNPQLSQLLPLVSDANAEAHRTESQKEAHLQMQMQTLTQALPYLITGQPLPEAWHTYFGGLATALADYDTALDRTLAGTIELLSGLLRPEQAALLDLRAPAGLGGEQSMTEQARARAERIGKLREVIRLVEGLRTLDFMTFLQVRPGRIEDFLTRYVDAGPGEVAAIRDRISEQIMEVYGIPTEEWEPRASEVAAEILESAGLGEEPQWQDDDTRPEVSWRELRDLLVADETLQVLQRIAGSPVAPAQP